MHKLKMPPTTTSPFLHPRPLTTPSTLSILHLKRDLLLPTILLPSSGPTDGYAEGPVTNTRFGSFPHSTLLDIPWGSQVRASFVDTGSRGRKRKRSPSPPSDPSHETTPAVTLPPPQQQQQQPNTSPHDLPPDIQKSTTHRGEAASLRKKREAAAAAARQQPSGYIHILPPTPETWTMGLPHRTQVVYTADYSYILQKLRVRPGTVLIEAGAGSGSFTHAAARAVYGPQHRLSPPSSASVSASAIPRTTTAAAAAAACDDAQQATPPSEGGGNPQWGRVHSYEFHTPRYDTLAAELSAHGLLDSVVTLSLRDVCTAGFRGTEAASAIFLDLPAPWLALPHLTRSSSSSADVLDPSRAVRVCTFSPCIEQVQRTVGTLRRLGWVEIEMMGVAARKVEVRREKVGVAYAGRKGDKGVSGHPGSVGEAVGRGREVEERGRRFHERQMIMMRGGAEEEAGEEEAGGEEKDEGVVTMMEKEEANVPGYREGRLVTRSEAEIKEHTSYLVFAVLPMAWTEEDERMATERVAEMGKDGQESKEMSRAMGKKARKRAAKEAAAGKNKGEEADEEAVGEAVKIEGEGTGVVEQAVDEVERDGVPSADAGEDVKMEEAEPHGR